MRVYGYSAGNIFNVPKYYTEKVKDGLNPNTVIKHHAVIRTALRCAVKQKLIRENPAEFVDKPKKKDFHSNFYLDDNINKLFNVAQGTSIEAPILLACYFGLRRSEVLGLRWDAVDLTNKILTIKHKVVKVKKNGKITFLCTDDLKTSSSYRILPLNDDMVNYFQLLLDRRNKNWNDYGASYITEYKDYVCVNEQGDLLKPDYVSDVFKKIIRRNGLVHIRFHDLRHSCASLLLDIGYDMKDIQVWLGHSNYQTTADMYAKQNPRKKKQMVNELGDKLNL